jgi:hypothetical protein
MLVVWAVGSVVTYFMLPVDWFMETIGFLAVFTEAMLGELMTIYQLPHLVLISNAINRRASIPS